MSEVKQLPRLSDAQMRASDPSRQVRLSASAGTGKTQVLTARVLRLLLSGVKPDAILCLTFTKAGATEMADRIHQRLSRWVNMKDTEIAIDLRAQGEAATPDMCRRARSLFAEVLDARGAGLRIQTIHSFCQSLLAAFPAEADIAPGFELLEERDAAVLAQSALADVLEGFRQSGDTLMQDMFARLVVKLGEDKLRGFLSKCASDRQWVKVLPKGAGLAPFVRRALSGGIEDVDGAIAILASDDGCDLASLRRVHALFGGWRKKDGELTAQAEKSLPVITDWLESNIEDRVEKLPALVSCWQTKEGTTRKGLTQNAEDEALIERVDQWAFRLLELKRVQNITQRITDALSIGRAYAEQYKATKAKAGAIDFNDVIEKAVDLLGSCMGQWIRYKLDQSVDHILVDEAQDTNAEQWSIVKAVAEDYFAGEGAKPDAHRTLFLVGDFKQAIFSFQGTDPREFEAATRYFMELAKGAEQEFDLPALNESYRSSPPILQLTDAVIANVGHTAFGLENEPPQHASAVGGSGRIVVLDPVFPESDAASEEADGAEESWLSDADLAWASRLAKQVMHWTTGGLHLRNKDRPAEPGDIMILLRSRGELARLIVSRLYEEGVPVAGVDRLQIHAPIAVQDLMACIRFALQPNDDLTLASLLVSPLMGWSQEQLYEAANRRKGPLWPHLRNVMDETALAVPARLLSMADMSTPYRFLEAVLSGPIAGRRKLIERLGEEARDPIEELLNLALRFERNHAATLQNFLGWFEANEEEIKRDPSRPQNKVRVMTAHGAKGLQAPVVVLADATKDPAFNKKSFMTWHVDGSAIPLFRPSKELRAGTLQHSATEQDQREAEEHLRLLYVAMTRAEEHLIVGGALNNKQKDGPGEKTWYTQIKSAAMQLGGVRSADNDALVWDVQEPPKPEQLQAETEQLWQGELPDWALNPAPPEAKPPKPLSPSSLGVADDEPLPPPSDAMQAAAQRGTLLHSLFERLPDVAADQRRGVADDWLRGNRGIADKSVRVELIDAALNVIDDPRFAEIFGPDALAEVPLAGVVNALVIAGTIDRLLVRDDVIRVVDFKTGRYVPSNADKVSRHAKAQMAAYVAVLEEMFPGKTVEAALLFTSGPTLITLPAAVLGPFKPGFTAQQQDLGQDDIVYAPLAS